MDFFNKVIETKKGLYLIKGWGDKRSEGVDGRTGRTLYSPYKSRRFCGGSIVPKWSESQPFWIMVGMHTDIRFSSEEIEKFSIVDSDPDVVRYLNSGHNYGALAEVFPRLAQGEKVGQARLYWERKRCMNQERLKEYYA